MNENMCKALRMGRVRPGECYRLYSSARMASFADFQLPEMQRSPLEELCLQVGPYTIPPFRLTEALSM